MNKKIPDDILIKLARLAPKVEPSPEGKKIKGHKSAFTTVGEFLEVSGLKPGRNLIPTSSIYEAYQLWANVPMDEHTFAKKLRNHLPVQENQRKANMKSITLIEKMKEIKSEEKRQK